jgi:hydroxyquinol 1,2-dioxygenase
VPDINQMTITDAVKASFRDKSNARFTLLLETFIDHLHDFTRETNLTQDEWIYILNFLYDCGQISTPERHEFILLSDVLGWSALVDMINTKGGGTELSNLGPFYLKDAPTKSLGADLAENRQGVIVLANGTVRDTLGNPLPGAVVDTWQADGTGMYPIQEKDQDPMDLRGVFTTDEKGRYYYTTVLPKSYTVPYDGPVGKLLTAGDRHPWRSKHFHYMVRAPKKRGIVTEVFFEGDEYIDSDAVFGVRESLIAKLKRVPADAEIEYELERRPDARMDFDFVLSPAAG